MLFRSNAVIVITKQLESYLAPWQAQRVLISVIVPQAYSNPILFHDPTLGDVIHDEYSHSFESLRLEVYKAMCLFSPCITYPYPYQPNK